MPQSKYLFYQLGNLTCLVLVQISLSHAQLSPNLHSNLEYGLLLKVYLKKLFNLSSDDEEM